MDHALAESNHNVDKFSKYENGNDTQGSEDERMYESSDKAEGEILYKYQGISQSYSHDYKWPADSFNFVWWLGLSNDEVDHLLGCFGPSGSAYEDSHVVNMLDGDPINCSGLERLLLHIKETWIKERGPLEEPEEGNSMCCLLFLNEYFDNSLTKFLDPSEEVCPQSHNWLEKVLLLLHILLVWIWAADSFSSGSCH